MFRRSTFSSPARSFSRVTSTGYDRLTSQLPSQLTRPNPISATTSTQANFSWLQARKTTTSASGVSPASPTPPPPPPPPLLTRPPPPLGQRPASTHSTSSSRPSLQSTTTASCVSRRTISPSKVTASFRFRRRLSCWGTTRGSPASTGPLPPIPARPPRSSSCPPRPTGP